jgi:anaerobic ribonucleoside-triphosphate reductase
MSNLSLAEKIEKFPVTCYSRVVGWFTPVKNFNPGKAAEFKDRVFFKVDK